MPTPNDGTTYVFAAHDPPSAVAMVRVNGVDILDAPVAGREEPEDLAQDVAAAINAHTSDPNYSARAVGRQVTVAAPDFGTQFNGYALEVDVVGAVEVANIFDFTGGVAPFFLEEATSTPGPFVKTFGAKMYALSDSVLHFSALGSPTVYTPEATGAGFIDMATFASGVEELLSMENYFDDIAVFSRNTVQVWSLDPDPDRNQQEQVLRNTGTRAPRSVRAYGDVDVFYLSDEGIRSLRAKENTLAAGISDVGLPIDSLVREKLDTLTDDEISRAVSEIEPQDNRYWLALGGTIYVLSHFPGSRISAWSVYEAGFDVEHIVRTNDAQIFVRSGDTIYLYGGEDGLTYDESKVTVRVPYLDAQRPADEKMWRQVTMGAQGTWTITPFSDPNQPNEADAPTELVGVSYGKLRHPIQANTTHLSIELINEEAGYARISNFAAHYDASEPG